MPGQRCPQPRRRLGHGRIGYRCRILVARHRRGLVAALLAAGVSCGVQAVRPAAPATVPVPVLAHDLPAGHRLSAADITVSNWPASARPAGLLNQPAGRLLTAAARRGEPVTDARAVPQRLSASAPHGTVTVAVRPADAADTSLVGPGQRADVLAAVSRGSWSAGNQTEDQHETTAEVVVADALVLRVGAPAGRSGSGSDPQPWLSIGQGATDGSTRSDGSTGSDGSTKFDGSGSDAAVVVLAVSPVEAARLANCAGSRRITVVGHQGPAP